MDTAIAINNVKDDTTAYNLEQFLSRFLKNLDISPDTECMYKHCIIHFFKWLVEGHLQQPLKEHIIQYKQTFKDKSLNTQNLHLSAVRQFFKWLELEGIYKDITKGIKIRGIRQADAGHIRMPLTKEQARQLLDGIDTSSIIGLRDYAIINIKLHTGLRDIELRRANVKDLDEKQERTILYIQRKGHTHKDNFIILNATTLQPLQDYLGYRGSSDKDSPLFITHGLRSCNNRMSRILLAYIMKKRLTEAGLKSKYIVGHSLRHTFATIALENGVKIEDIQTAMGHQSINTTLRYIKGRDRMTNPVEDRINFN